MKITLSFRNCPPQKHWGQKITEMNGRTPTVTPSRKFYGIIIAEPKRLMNGRNHSNTDGTGKTATILIRSHIVFTEFKVTLRLALRITNSKLRGSPTPPLQAVVEDHFLVFGQLTHPSSLYATTHHRTLQHPGARLFFAKYWSPGAKRNVPDTAFLRGFCDK